MADINIPQKGPKLIRNRSKFSLPFEKRHQRPLVESAYLGPFDPLTGIDRFQGIPGVGLGDDASPALEIFRTQNLPAVNATAGEVTGPPIDVAPEDNRRGPFGTKKRNRDSRGGADSLLGPLDALQLGTDIGAPAIYEALNAGRTNQLRQDSQVDLQQVELSQPGVRGLYRGNFALPNKPPSGSTLDTQIAEKKFNDAFQKSKEIEFDMRDDAFRQAQRDRNNTIENQGRMFNAQRGDQEQFFNANSAKQELLGLRLPDKISSFESMFANTSKNIGQIGSLQNFEEVSLIKDIITRQEAGNYTEEDIAWARNKLDAIRSRRLNAKKGGKMKKKTKFSY